MPALSIEQLNARRDRINRNRDTARLGGTMRSDRLVSAETQRAWAEAAAEYVPSLEDKVAAVFDDFRSWCRNLPSIEYAIEMANDDTIPF